MQAVVDSPDCRATSQELVRILIKGHQHGATRYTSA
jgi:hypothetical protein